MTTARNCLLIVLRSEIGLATVPAWPITTLSVDGHAYQPTGPEWSGFYDWLRSGDGTVLGVRYHSTEETQFLLEEAKRLNYASVGVHGDLCIFFGENHAFDPAQSEDQDFAYDQIFVASVMGSAICFSTDNLSAEQVAAVMKDRSVLSVETSHAPSERVT
jgi:hypothetical protein